MNFREGDIEFSFDDNFWWLIYGDNHVDFTKIKKYITGTKSCDFIGFYREEQRNEALFLEVKDFRSCDLPNYYQTVSDCYDTLLQKVRDSLSAILNGSRNSTNGIDEWRQWIEYFQNQENRLYVLMWREHSTHFINNPRHEQSIMHTERTIKAKLHWLSAFICFIDKKEFEENPLFQGLVVTNHPPSTK